MHDTEKQSRIFEVYRIWCVWCVQTSARSCTNMPARWHFTHRVRTMRPTSSFNAFSLYLPLSLCHSRWSKSSTVLLLKTLWARSLINITFSSNLAMEVINPGHTCILKHATPSKASQIVQKGQLKARQQSMHRPLCREYNAKSCGVFFSTVLQFNFKIWKGNLLLVITGILRSTIGTYRCFSTWTASSRLK